MDDRLKDHVTTILGVLGATLMLPIPPESMTAVLNFIMEAPIEQLIRLIFAAIVFGLGFYCFRSKPAVKIQYVTEGEDGAKNGVQQAVHNSRPSGGD